MNLQAKISSTLHSTTMCNDVSSLNTRVAIHSFPRTPFPAKIEFLILLFEYIQLISQIFIFFPNTYFESTDGLSSFFKGILFIAKIFNPGYWVPFEDGGMVPIIVLMFVLGFMVLKILLFVYIIGVATERIPQYYPLKFLWKWIFKLQGRFINQFVTSFWTHGVVSVHENAPFERLGLGDTGFLALCGVCIGIEYLFSFTLQFRLDYVLPTKEFLSSKDSVTRTLCLFQKLLIQILQMSFFHADPKIASWIFASLNILVCVFRDFHFYTTFPFYQFKALYCQMVLLVLASSLSASCFFQALAKELGDEEPDVGFVFIVWVILAILGVKLAHGFLYSFQFDLTTTYHKHRCPEILMYKIQTLQRLRKERKPAYEGNSKYAWEYLYNCSANKYAKKTLNLDNGFPSDVTVDINEKTTARRMFLYCLEGWLAEHPKDNFLKLYIAYFYAKKMKLYGQSMKLITELQTQTSTMIELNSSLLLFEVQKHIKHEYGTKDSKVDMLCFTKSHQGIARMKKKMIEQADLQIKLCQEIVNDIPDLSKIYNISQSINSLRKETEKKIEKVLNVIPEFFIDPYVLCAQYELTLNHSLTDYLKYNKIYNKKNMKYSKYFKEDMLGPENFYQGNNVFLMISGQKTDYGKIIFCSKSAEKILGGDARLYSGTQVSAIFPPSLQNNIMTSLKIVTESGDQTGLLNTVTRSFVIHKDGHVVEIDYFMSIHPFLTQGFYYVMVLRPVPVFKDYLLVLKSGDIEGATLKAGHKLGLMNHGPQELVNIRNLSKELSDAHFAFNMVSSAQTGRTETGRARTGRADTDPRVKSEKSEDFQDFNSNFLTTTKSQKSQIRNTIIHNKTSKKSDAADELTYEQAQEICHIFTNSGKELLLKYNRKREENSTNKDVKSLHMYHCRVSQLEIEKNTINLFILEERSKGGQQNQETFEFQSIPKHQMYTQQDDFHFTTEKLTSQGIDALEQSMDASGFFKSENEKQDGWINFMAISTEMPQKHLISDYDPLTTMGNGDAFPMLNSPLSSPMSSGVDLRRATTQNTPLIKRQTPHFLGGQAGSRSTKTMSKDQEQEQEVVETQMQVRIVNPAHSVNGSQLSRTSQQRKVSQAFRTALAMKYRSRYSVLLCLAFYLMIIAVFATQLGLKLILNQNIDSLSVKKSILSNAQTSNYNLIGLHFLFRLVDNISSGSFMPAELGIYGFLGPTFSIYALINLQSLSTCNQAVLQSTDSLPSESRDILFAKDVNIYDQYFGVADQTFVTMSNYEGTNRLIESGFQLITKTQGDPIGALPGYKFLYRNALNDLLVKNEVISNLFNESLGEQRDRIGSIVNIFMIVIVISLLIIMGVFCIMIYKQYAAEKKNLLAIVKLNNNKIFDVLVELNRFKKTMENEKAMLNRQETEEVISHSRQIMKSATHKKVENSRKDFMKVPKYTGVTKRYGVQLGYLVFFIAVLIAMVVASSFSDKMSVAFFESKQDQTYLSDRIKSRAYLAEIVATELLLTDNVGQIENTPALDKLEKMIAEVKSLRNTASTLFVDEDTSYNSTIKTLLYDDACSIMPPDGDGAFFCPILTASGMKTGLMYLLTQLESSLTERQNAYIGSDRTFTARRDIVANNFQLYVTTILFVNTVCLMISSTINAGFQTSLDDAATQRTTVMVFFTIVLVVICFLIWFSVIKKLREANDKFKNTLKALPAALVLSSFLLKSFLIKTSKGALDFVKNEI